MSPKRLDFKHFHSPPRGSPAWLAPRTETRKSQITSPQRDPGNTPTVTTLITSETAQPLVAELPLPEEVTERYLEIRTVPEQ